MRFSISRQAKIQSNEDVEENLAPYIRNEQTFKLGSQTVEMQTAWNLPEFDSLAHDTALAMNALKSKVVSGRGAVLESGTGTFAGVSA